MARQRNSSIAQKVLASIVNVAVVIMVSMPVLWLADLETWKMANLIAFFAYNRVMRRRCLGSMVAGTFTEAPASMTWSVGYTASYASLFWSVHFPFDIALVNGLCIQLPCVLLTGTTFHGLIGGGRTLQCQS